MQVTDHLEENKKCKIVNAKVQDLGAWLQKFKEYAVILQH